MWSQLSRYTVKKTASRSVTHLDSESESCWVQWVFSVQLAVHRKRPADVVQGKNAVGVPWMDGRRERERETEMEIRQAEGQMHLALQIIQHNLWDGVRNLWKRRWWMSYMSVFHAIWIQLLSLPALGWPNTSTLSTTCLSQNPKVSSITVGPPSTASSASPSLFASLLDVTANSCPQRSTNIRYQFPFKL